MALNEKKSLIDKLLENFFAMVPDTIGFVISDNKGNLVFSKIDSDLENSSKVNSEQLSKFNCDLEPYLCKLQEHFSKDKKYGSSVIETNDFRLLNILINHQVFTFVLDIYASLEITFPYVYLTVEKIHQILLENTIPQLIIPRLGNISGQILDDAVFGKNDEWSFKYIIIGDPGVGKTSLVNKFVKDQLATDYRPTIGLNVMAYDHEFMGYKIKMNLFDIGSQKIFRRVRMDYYKGANAAILVFDLSNKESINSIKDWYNEMVKFIGYSIPFIIVGNKSDLSHIISFEDGELIAKSLGCSYIETSALEGSNVGDCFNLLSYNLIKRKS